jgi:hypothetical protein
LAYAAAKVLNAIAVRQGLSLVTTRSATGFPKIIFLSFSAVPTAVCLRAYFFWKNLACQHWH